MMHKKIMLLNFQIKVIQENKRFINNFLKENDLLDFVYILVLSVKTRFLL